MAQRAFGQTAVLIGEAHITVHRDGPCGDPVALKWNADGNLVDAFQCPALSRDDRRMPRKPLARLIAAYEFGLPVVWTF